MEFARAMIRSNRILNFNMVERDNWIQAQAKSIAPGSTVLDVGAGSCPYRSLFAHCDYKAQDAACLEDHQLRSHRGYGTIDYYCDATAIPIPDQSVDVVLCTEVMEHVPEPIRVVREIGRILKPGGKLLLTAPLGSGIHQAPFHFYGGYTPYWYNKFLAEAGFENIQIEPNGGFYKHFGQECMRFSRMTFPLNLDVNLFIKLLWFPAWLLMMPWLAIMAPLVCHFMDRLDKDKGFTIGYHVTAEKH